MTSYLNIAAGSDTGRMRQVNEDAVYAYSGPKGLGEPVGLLAVADGIGGHKAGEVASHLAIQILSEHLRHLLEPVDSPVLPGRAADLIQSHGARNGRSVMGRRALKKAVEVANRAIYRYSLRHPKDAGNLGTTLASALIFGNMGIIANVGDSRVYHQRGTDLRQLTEDHSIVGEMIMDGRLDPELAFDHPHRSVITRALGHHSDVAIDLFDIELQPGDRLLLCSDGLWEMIREPSLISWMLSRAESLEEAVETLIGSANQNGGFDNISVVVGEIVSQ